MIVDFKQQFYDFLPGAPTSDQVDLIERMERFLFQSESRSAFIIRGYAGTGKTTAIAAMVKVLPALKMKTVLLAPTGRAAKVLSKYSGKKALTIHKKIYQSKKQRDGSIHIAVAHNLHSNTIFIVDEASMISDETFGAFSKATSLLNDLIEYVYQGENCKVVFIGDTAQLPPVASNLSPALDPKPLKQNYYLQLKGVELKQVLRQAAESGILMNATQLRMQTTQEHPYIKFQLDGYPDIESITGIDLEDALSTCYSRYGEDDTVLICRSNKRANDFNQQIRVRIKGLEEVVSTSDRLMVVKNNYHWLDEKSPIGFIANGDMAEIMSMGSIEEKYGLSFLNANIRLVDYPEQQAIEVKLLLDPITSEAASLSSADSKRLWESVLLEYAELGTKRKQMEAVKKDPYFNALQVKFAYAVTCHKSQGGQWKAVFVDQGYLTEEMIDQEYARWLYTAITRATDKLYLLNFHERFFGIED